MAPQNVTSRSTTASTAATDSATPNYARPLAVVTTLFFMWGFLTSLNDILVPHLKSIFDLSYTRAMLVQFAFFSSYFLFSVPWSKAVNIVGYQRSMVAGLLTMTVGAFLFIPAASAASYPLFLTALVFLACGITGLQVAANPYVVVLGKPETASSRLDLTQAFNSLGTTIGPKIGGLLILSAAPLALEQLRQLAPQALQAYRVQTAASVKMPYAVIGVALLLLAVLIGASNLPRIATTHAEQKSDDTIWKHPNLVFGCDWHFRLRGRGSFHRKLPGAAILACRDCGSLRKDRGRFCFVLLGWLDDRAVSGCRRFCGGSRPGYAARHLCDRRGCTGQACRCSSTDTRRCGPSSPSDCSTRSCFRPSSAWGWPNWGRSQEAGPAY